MRHRESVVVLGGQVLDGGKPAPEAEALVDKADTIARGYHPSFVITTGRHSMAMRQLVKGRFEQTEPIRGIPVYAADFSQNMIASALNARRKVKELQRKPLSMYVVTVDYRCPRAEFVFKRIFGDKYEISVSPARTPYNGEKEWLYKYEQLALLGTRLLLMNLSPGDEPAIQRRLESRLGRATVAMGFWQPGRA